MKHRIAVAVAACLASASIAFATPARVTDFADKEFSIGDIVSSLRTFKTRGLTIGEDEAAASSPRISLQLRFARNSAELTAEAKRRLDVVGGALNEAELANANLVVSGHTDITGSYELNLLLSKRRAEAVKAYLVSAHDVAPERLKAVGRGPNELLDEANPRNPANRRVQLAVAG
jgi:outer membrane protein OmpA-like peptidoglycan-associated protein